MLGQLTLKEIEHFLNIQTIGRIGCTVNEQTYIVPITYAYDGTYIYGHSREGLKIRMMRQNPKICFEVDRMHNMANWKSVILQGHYEELLGKKAREAMAFLQKKLSNKMISETSQPIHGLQHFHQNETSSIKTVIFRIKIIEKSGRFERLF